MISVQVLSESAHAARWKRGISRAGVGEALAAFRAALDEPVPLTTAIHVAALKRAAQGGLAWCDALLVASALEAGRDTPWTEDRPDGRRFGRLTLRNPFA